MKTTTGYYSIIQYCPDRSRLEAANVGVLLFCPDLRYIRTRVSQANQHIRRFFGGREGSWDWKRVNATKVAIQHQVEMEGKQFRCLEDLQEFIKSQANSMTISYPRSVLVDRHPDEVLDELFTGLVEKEAEKRREPALRKSLEKVFQEKGVSDCIQRDVPVELPEFERTETIPFAYVNGRLNLIQPVRFQQGELAIERACKYRIEGRYIYENPDPKHGERQLAVVGRFASGDKESVSVIRNLLDKDHVKFYPWEDLDPLIQDIREASATHRG